MGKVLLWVDPATCGMWEHHNREYELLTEENCRDLIDGIRAQGQQEFPAVVRRLEGEDHAYEVICDARRHFAVSWLRANNYPQFRYMVGRARFDLTRRGGRRRLCPLLAACRH